MTAAPSGEPDAATPFSGLAAVVLGADGRVLRWSREAAALLGRPARDVVGRPARDLVAPPAVLRRRGGRPAQTVYGGRVMCLLHRTGHPVETVVRLVPLSGTADVVALAAPAGHALVWEQDRAIGRALFTQDRMAVALHDAEQRPVRANAAQERPDWPRTGDGRPAHVLDLVSWEGHEEAAGQLARTLRDGVPLPTTEQRLREPGPGAAERVLTLTALPLRDADGGPFGTLAVVTDATEQRRAWHQLQLVYDASRRIGGSLDVTRTAQDLVEVLVPVLGDMATVEISETVLAGGDPAARIRGSSLEPTRRVAAKHAAGAWPADLVQPGQLLPRIPDRPEFRRVGVGGSIIASDAAQSRAMLGDDPELVRLILPEGLRASLGTPLFARGLPLGYVLVYRTENPVPFDEEDTRLLREIVTRAALNVDNARRYTRERRMAEMLQRSLLPPVSTSTAAAQTSGLYLPAGGGASVGGDWFDALPLSSLRVALVVGDVYGHGLRATATMARLRTAVQTLAELDLEPDELLIRLDDLVQRMAGESDTPDAMGATCLYAVYDPVTGCCRVASAGHPAPAVARPDGSSALIGVTPGPPLGVGGMPFEMTETELVPGSVLALYSDGLVRHGPRSASGAPDTGALPARLAAACRPGRTLEEIGQELAGPLTASPPPDDVTLLLVRTRTLPDAATACWQFPADPQAVAEAREATAGQLADWGLEELSFTTELVVSELMTNAIRYAGGPVGLRLIRDSRLVCEVTDTSNTQPRLRRAHTTDEGGRGLFLVAQLTSRWGSRYGARGKTIWTEQAIGPD
ncbi:SpoIIE family protein phosphatase [Streptomyces sp. TRM 70351]|uniref:ATP-binding SpoIIE family protein phosphatase n=1 Tax=Streptomyces sp. TRM 70351 TaxID=3116552 RepID=UPI002E7BD8E6|nr:SpoIIE family protein phosphatase [Streptomyces sp. TRM 70351]MEE1927120.1 SpoIIE family protein phosphatase [Streptomyces sp. TRM 70351]